MRKLCVAILLAFGCLSTSSALALSPPMDECSADADCPSGSECVRSPTTCVEWPEPGSEVCFSNMICTEPTPTSCNTSESCAPGEVCVPDHDAPVCDCAFIDENGDGINDVDCNCPVPMICQRPTMPNECFEDADCAQGERCYGSDAACACPFIDEDGDGISDVECDCAPVGLCQPAQVECTTDADCSPGERCESEDYGPEPECDCAYIDDNGDGINDIDCMCPPARISHCVSDDRCQSNDDCGPGEACILSTEESTPDCADGMGDCTSPALYGQCETISTGECETDADCGPGEFCGAEITECPPCAFIDDDGDGMNDIACDCPPPVRQCERRSDSCGSDIDCAAGQRCEFPFEQPVCTCPAEDDCDCAQQSGTCVDNAAPTCASDADCASTHECVIEEDGVCPPCAPIDGVDGDDGSDCSCEPSAGRCEPRPQTSCQVDTDCGSGERCEVSATTACGCGRDGQEDPSLPDGTAPERCECQDEGVCVATTIEPRYPNEPKFRWGQDEKPKEDPDGTLFFCAAANTNTNAPAEGGVLLLMIAGMVGVVRRRKRRA